MFPCLAAPLMDTFILVKIIFGVPQNTFLSLKSFHRVNFFPLLEIMFGIQLDLFLHRKRISRVLLTISLIQKSLARFMIPVMLKQILFHCRLCLARPSCR